MFDTYQVGPSRVYHETNTRITEHRAPTDESVRLLKELEREAQNKLVGIIRNKDNGIDFSAHVFDDCLNPFEHSIAISCSVNGKKIDFTMRLPCELKRVELANAIVNEIGKEIARQLVIKNINSLESIFK